MFRRLIDGLLILAACTWLHGNRTLAQVPDFAIPDLAEQEADSAPGSWLTALELALVQPRLRYDVGAEHFRAPGWLIPSPINCTWKFPEGDSLLMSLHYLGSDGRVMAINDPALRERDYEPNLEAFILEGDYCSPTVLLAPQWRCQLNAGARLVNVSASSPLLGSRAIRTHEEVFAGGPHVAVTHMSPLGDSGAEVFGRLDVGWIGGVTQRDTVAHVQSAPWGTPFGTTVGDPFVWSSWEIGLNLTMATSDEPFHLAIGYCVSSWQYTGQVFPGFGVRGWSEGTCVRGPFLRGELRF